MRQAVLKTTAASFPVTLPEAKNHLDIVDDDSQNELIQRLIEAGCEYVSEITSRALIESTWRLLLSRFPECGDDYEDRIVLPKGNLRSVTSVKYWPVGSSAITWNSTNYDVDTDSEPGAVVLADSISWPTDSLRAFNGVEVEFVAGWDEPGEASPSKGQVPIGIKQAILLLVGHWYENRSAVTIGNAASAVSRQMELAVNSLVASKRLVYL